MSNQLAEGVKAFLKESNLTEDQAKQLVLAIKDNGDQFMKLAEDVKLGFTKMAHDASKFAEGFNKFCSEKNISEQDREIMATSLVKLADTVPNISLTPPAQQHATGWGGKEWKMPTLGASTNSASATPFKINSDQAPTTLTMGKGEQLPPAPAPAAAGGNTAPHVTPANTPHIGGGNQGFHIPDYLQKYWPWMLAGGLGIPLIHHLLAKKGEEPGLLGSLGEGLGGAAMMGMIPAIYNSFSKNPMPTLGEGFAKAKDWFSSPGSVTDAGNGVNHPNIEDAV